MPALPLINQPGAPSSSQAAAPRSVGLLAVLLVVGLLAVPCGILLIVNGLGMPRSVLAGTPFDSFLVPGLLLSIVVGGSALGAAWLTRVRHPRARVASLVAGLILLGWIVIETVMIDDGRVLQAVVLIAALLIISLAWRDRPASARRESTGVVQRGDRRPRRSPRRRG